MVAACKDEHPGQSRCRNGLPVLSADRYSEYHEISVLLEGKALVRACARITQKQVDALIEKADRIQLDLDAGRTAGYAQRFNSVLMEISASSWPLSIIRSQLAP